MAGVPVPSPPFPSPGLLCVLSQPGRGGANHLHPRSCYLAADAFDLNISLEARSASSCMKTCQGRRKGRLEGTGHGEALRCFPETGQSRISSGDGQGGAGQGGRGRKELIRERGEREGWAGDRMEKQKEIQSGEMKP